MPVPLHENPLVQAWVEQFDENDKADANLILQSIRCISANGFQKELRFALDSLRQTLEPPIALYAAREIDDDANYFPNKKVRPDAVDGHDPVGSEGSCAHLATVVSREFPGIYLNHPPVLTLRKRKCHNIVILDDVVGSGSRITKFIGAMLRTDSIRSWRSFGWIQFHVVAYGISPEGEANIVSGSKGNRSSSGITFSHSGRALAAAQMLDVKTVSRLKRVCTKYGKSHNMPWYYRTGFGSQIAVIVFSHGCPNNAPAVLWFNSATWNPLFPNRSIPEPLLSHFKDETSLQEQSVILASLDAPAVARGSAFLAGSEEERSALLVLSAIRKKIRDVQRLALATDLPRSTVELVIDRCVRFGLIDNDLYLTDSGRDGLARAERERVLAPTTMSVDEFYYPSSLRGG